MREEDGEGSPLVRIQRKADTMFDYQRKQNNMPNGIHQRGPQQAEQNTNNNPGLNRPILTFEQQLKLQNQATSPVSL